MTQTSVLIVEDEGIVAEDLRQTLIDAGYDAFAVADSADEAILRASERCPDIVLMDIRIRGRRDGIETAGILRAQFGVPIIFLTAHADDATIARAKQVEPHGYLTKPVRDAELRSAIEIAVFRHELERRLRERERWFATTLHSIADAVVTVDLAGIVTFVNAEAELLIGLGSDELVGRRASDVLRLVDAQRNALPSPLDRALDERRVITLDEADLINLATGSIRAITDSAAPVIDDARTLGAVMVFRDVTEQKRVRQQLELADRLASLGTMAAGVAHEINNPLAVVMANASFASERLERAQGPGAAAGEDWLVAATDALQALADIGAAAARINKIVADLQAFSRPAPAPTMTGSGRTKVLRAVEWAVRTTAAELRLRARLVLELAPVPDIAGDEARLGQVFVNLLINAAQAIEPGALERNQVTVTTSVDGDGRVVVEIRDTGAGMADEVRRRIFEPFFTTKPVGAGTGLGLSICHGIVTSLGGELEAASGIGLGTTMRVRLPAAPPERAPVERPERAPPATRRGRILVIDDEPMMLRALTRMLSGHDVVAVDRAEDALARLDRGERFDVIVSDLMMPTMTGMGFYEALLARSPAVARQVVFITGGALTARTTDFLESIPNRWLPKPFSAAALQALVAERLGPT